MGTWNLIIEDDAGKTIVIPLSRDVITIGRKEGNTIRLTERNVSRFHARLTRESSAVSIEDLKSFNGIKLNGDRIQGRVSIQEGDLIEIGDYHLALQAQGASEPALGGTAGATQQTDSPVGMKSGHLPPTAEDNDQFAGDTQRWEPSHDLNTHEGILQTQEDPRHVRTSSAEADPTMPAPVSVVDLHPTIDEKLPIHAGALGDTERMTLEIPPPPKGPQAQSHSWPPPPMSSTLVDTRMNPAPGVAFESNHVVQPVDTVPHLDLPMSSAPGGGADTLIELLPSFRPAEGPQSPLKLAEVGQVMPPTVRIPVSPDGAVAARRAREESETVKQGMVIDDTVMSPRLVVLNTIFAGSTFALRNTETVIGRTEDNDVTIEHRSVSRNHAKIVRDGEKLRLVDLKSANGVLVNGSEIDSATLRPGDVMELGRVRIRYVPPGERFMVPADEIERARMADAAGDDGFDDTSTHVTTSSLRPPGGHIAERRGFSPAVVAVASLVVLSLIVGVALFLMHGRAARSRTATTATAPVEAGLPSADAVPAPNAATKPAAAMVQFPVEPLPTGETAPAPDPGVALVAQMKTQLRAGNYREALKLYDGVSAEMNSFVEATALAKKTRQLGADEAVAKGERAKPGSKALAEAVAELAYFAPDSDKRAKLEARLDGEPRARPQTKAAAPPPEDANAIYLKATQSFFQRGNLNEALELLNRVVQLQPDHAEAHRGLGTVYGKLGKPALAVQEYKRYLQLNPGGADAGDVRGIISKYEAQLGR